MALNEPLRQQISEILASNRIVLFMKGNRQMPQCGFSAQVVQILDKLVPSYETVNVLRSPELRDGIKEFSQWPTIPQLYVDGQLIGGCDIVREMNASGELQKRIGAEVSGAPAATEPQAPTITISEAAAKAFTASVADAGGGSLRLQIDAQFQHELLFGPRGPDDIEVCTSGLTLLLDRSIAGRANGVSIDFIDGSDGGFKITNPNAPPRVKQLTAQELKAILRRSRSQSRSVELHASAAPSPTESGATTSLTQPMHFAEMSPLRRELRVLAE